MNIYPCLQKTMLFKFWSRYYYRRKLICSKNEYVLKYFPVLQWLMRNYKDVVIGISFTGHNTCVMEARPTYVIQEAISLKNRTSLELHETSFSALRRFEHSTVSPVQMYAFSCLSWPLSDCPQIDLLKVKRL